MAEIQQIDYQYLKTHYMMFHRTQIKNKTVEDGVHISGKNLVNVNNTKFLGVIIDSKLKWSDHIRYTKNKISKSIGILTKIRRFLNKNIEKSLFLICLSIPHILR